MAALDPDIAKVEMHIVEMTNGVRRDAKLGSLAGNAMLTKAARDYARFLAKSGLFSHTADGREPAKRAEGAGYTFCEIGENLALNQDGRGFEARDLASKAMTGWINSPGHRANIMAPHVTEIGVGIARSADTPPKFIAVQLFGRPSSASIEFQVVNASGSALTYTFGGKSHDLAPRLSVTHTACRPDTLVFMKPGGLFGGAKEVARQAPENGKLYTLSAGTGGAISIETSERRKIK